MKKNIALIAAVLLMLIVSESKAQLNFYPSNKDFNSALNAAKVLKKYLFIEFYTDWCINCKKMEADVFTDPELSAYINKNYVPVKLNAEFFNVMDLCEQYGIKSYPTVLVLDPTTKKVLGKYVGYYGVIPLHAEVKKIVYNNKK